MITNTIKGERMLPTTPRRCECADACCEADVFHFGRCAADAAYRLDRIDMEGVSVHFCASCGDDALNSGVFALIDDDTDDATVDWIDWTCPRGECECADGACNEGGK